MGLITAACLMGFLIWSYNALNKSFAVANGDVAENSTEKFSLKRLLITILLFLGCFFFISFAINATRTNIMNELREEQLKAFIARQKKAEDAGEIGVEQSKAATDKNKGIRIIPANEITTKFSDVAGLKEAKDEVEDLIAFLRNPEEFTRLGAKSPKGILLYGEPGTGKTLLARAIAGEANVSFIAVAGAEFDEEYVGVGAARVRHLFETARQNAPCIIFIDEIDALAHKRHAHDPAWSAQTVNQLLAEMDGLDGSKNAGIVVIGASNRIDAMDPAMLRPGRLDRHIKLDVPSLIEREEVLTLYFAKVSVDPKLSPKEIAKITSGFSSAELANLVNEAAINATKSKKNVIEKSDFDVAKDRIILGSKHEARNITPKTRKLTAYHEAGHALVGYLLNPSQPLYKVTITPRGPTLGHTSFESKSEQYSMSKQEIDAILATQLAGRVAEELVFGENQITTGAESDLKGASELAYNMVTKWGYSKRIGLVYQNSNASVISREAIEQEIQSIINTSYMQTKQILTNNRDKLDALAKALLEYETLDAAQVKMVIEGKSLNAKEIAKQ